MVSPGIAGVPAILLVGGLGSRLRPVTGDLPKPMAPVLARPFLEHLLVFLRRSGVREVVLCVGYGAEVIRAHFGDGTRLGLVVGYSVERDLLGTGGALKLGMSVAGDPARCIAMNGDSFIELDLAGMLRAHVDAGAAITVALASVTRTDRFGAVSVDPETGVIVSFGEKQGTGPGLINGGVYIVERQVVQSIPGGVVSFERDVLAARAGRDIRGFPADGMFLDIGIPEDYRRLEAAPESFLAAVQGNPRG